MRSKTGTTAQPCQYVGNAWDAEAKLYDLHARAYDQGVGRLTSKDPVAGLAQLPQTLNPYPYGVNNPLAYPDPSGKLAPALLVIPIVAYLGKNAAQSGAISGGEYYLTHRADKGGIDWVDFAWGVPNAEYAPYRSKK